MDKIKHKEAVRRYYLKNRRHIIDKTQKWRKENPDRVKIITAKALKKYVHSAKGIYRCIKQTSRVKNRGIMISKERFIEWFNKQDKKCIYCGISQTDAIIKTQNRLHVDRLNNKLGYIENNLGLACGICNAIKSDILTTEEMKIIGKLIIRKRWQQ